MKKLKKKIMTVVLGFNMQIDWIVIKASKVNFTSRVAQFTLKSCSGIQVTQFGIVLGKLKIFLAVFFVFVFVEGVALLC